MATSRRYGNIKRKGAYRSGLEANTASQLERKGVPFLYEGFKIRYLVPASLHYYTPDFVLMTNGIIVETKGQFTSEDRKKHILIKEQHPDLDIRFVFSNANSKLSKRSNTTYGDWCEKHGFKFATKAIPEVWLTEPLRSYLPSLKKGGVIPYVQPSDAAGAGQKVPARR